jgi:hypothetical protein
MNKPGVVKYISWGMSSLSRGSGLILGLLLAFVAIPARAVPSEPAPEQLEFFERDVRPLLAENCYKCHSLSSEKLKGGLLLDSREGVMRGGKDGAVISPGQPNQSRLVEAVHYRDPHLQMPPKGRLSDKQIAILADWVKMGAPWPEPTAPESILNTPGFNIAKRRADHWAWQPIRSSPPPAVTNAGWPANPVDNFILAKLESHQLQPAPPADRRTLLRRLYFDLIGLPPTTAEMEDFVGDSSPGAYEKVVDRLLASPRFGERWARHWLDLVRYAETLGHETDFPIQHAWRYRDYVIRAFNADVPYNQFVTEHIAGDLLAKPRLNPNEHFNESLIATGFYWLGQNEHSPVDVRQNQAEVIDNQIDVLTKTFLGLTVACARCHDHKFDAISTKDYYSLYGVLEGSRYAQRSIDSAPQLRARIGTLEQLKAQIRTTAAGAWSKQSKQVAEYLLAAAPATAAKAGQKRTLTTHPDLLPAWSNALSNTSLSDPTHPLYAWAKLSGTNGLDASDSFRKRWDTLVAESLLPAASGLPTNCELFADLSGSDRTNWFADGEAFRSGAGGRGDFLVGETNRPVAGVVYEPCLNDGVVTRRLEGALRSPTFPINRRYLYIRAAGHDSRIRVCVDNFTVICDPIYGGLKKHLDSETPVWMTFDLNMWKGHRAYVELSDVSTSDFADGNATDGSSTNGFLSASQVIFSDLASPPPASKLSRWNLLLGPQPVDSLQALASRYQKAFRQAIKTWRLNPAQFSATQEAQLAYLNWLTRNGLLDNLGDARLTGLVAQYHQVESSMTQPDMVPAMADGNGQDEQVFIRGNHNALGDVVHRRFLTALSTTSSAPFHSGSGRLELAECMTDPSNPFLARVMVNRVWLHLFGRGIVPTPDNFGVLGEPPTHPELLDWLAHWYRVDAGWSNKALIKLLVTSRAYRMSSQSQDAIAEEKDPENLLFHRMTARRLEGEAIRDAMLSISGRLDNTMFGPSVPVYLTPFMDSVGRPKDSGPLDGAGRRSIYLEVRRNFLSPLMRAFDAPVPFSTIGKRTVSNVPAQSLILLNDPFVIGQAQLWAKHILSETSLSPEQRITRIYLEAIGCPPSQKDLAEILAFVKQQGLAYASTHPANGEDESVWADVCQVMFNLKEFSFVQ